MSTKVEESNKDKLVEEDIISKLSVNKYDPF